MKKVILTLIIVLLAIPSQVAKPQAENEQNDSLGEYLPARKEAIHNYYEDKLTEMRFSTKEKIMLLDIAEKSQSTCLELSEWADLAEAVLKINNLESDSHNLRQTSTQTPSERLAAALSEIAKRKSQILADLEWETLRLEKQRKYEETEGLEKFIKKQERQLTTELQETYGIIGGIIYSQDNPAVVIDNMIIHQGESIHGAKILKINKNSVLFQKNDNTWTQKLRETRKTNWQ